MMAYVVTMIPTSSSISMKRISSYVQLSTISAQAVPSQSYALQLVSHRKSGESGEESMSRMARSLENLINIGPRKIGLTHGNI